MRVFEEWHRKKLVTVPTEGKEKKQQNDGTAASHRNQTQYILPSGVRIKQNGFGFLSYQVGTIPRAETDHWISHGGLSTENLSTESFHSTPASQMEKWQMIPHNSRAVSEGQNIGILGDVKKRS